MPSLHCVRFAVLTLWHKRCKLTNATKKKSMGKAHQLINELIEKRSKGKEFLKISTQMKLLMKGIDTRKINADTPDDEAIIKKIYETAAEFNITLG